MSKRPEEAQLGLRSPSWRSASATVLALALLGSGPCGDKSNTPVVFRNESDELVYIHVVGPAGRERETFNLIAPRDEELVHTPPSRAGHCTTRTLVARTEEGREIDRVEPPLCDGETWVIGD